MDQNKRERSRGAVVIGPATVSEAIEAYHSRGWNVIPIRSPATAPHGEDPVAWGKRPTTNWQHWTTEHQTDADVRELFPEGTQLNIGVVTGSVSNLLILDADGDEGARSLAALVGGNPDETLPIHPIVRTGRGRHDYFQLPPQLRGRKTSLAAILGPGTHLDIRGEGGQVVAPPSVHGSGAAYRWITWMLRVPELPDAVVTRVVDALEGRLRVTPASVAGTDAAAAPLGAPKDWGDWDALFERGAPEGERNNALTSQVGRWFTMGLGPAAIRVLALDWARRVCLPEREALSVVRSVERTHRRNTPAIAPEPVPDELVERIPPALATALTSGDRRAQRRAAVRLLEGGNLTRGQLVTLLGWAAVPTDEAARVVGWAVAKVSPSSAS